MFQLWKLVLLCGLVSGTSAGLFQALGNGLGNIVDNLKPIIDNGLEDISCESIRVMTGSTQNLFPKHYAAFPGAATGAALCEWFTGKGG